MASIWPYRPPPTTKYCFLPGCKNNTTLTPQKNLFCVPAGRNEEWCRAAGLDRVPKRTLFICEDHLDLEEDMENYTYWKIMKVNARLKPCLPAFLRQPLIETNQQQMYQARPTTSASEPSDEKPKPSTVTCSCGIMCCPNVTNQKVQVKVTTKDQSTNCTEPSNKTSKKRKFEVISCSSDNSHNASPIPSCDGSTFEVLEEDTPSSNTPTHKEENNLIGRQFILNIIKKKPMQYLGLPKDYFWMIENLASRCNSVTSLGVITTLYKIKNDDTFSKISDLFEISLATIWRSYFPTLTILSKFLNQFIYWPPASAIKKNLPDAFKVHRDYAQIQAIIDCFEVQIQQPSNPVDQSLTWSQYKSCNTAKFLISATPDGFINFISIGYGGRMSDIALVEQCGFIDVIPPNCTILADRGFKNLEPTLSHKGIKLVRPPSVFTNIKSTKEEVLRTKVIASLRVHIERVIRRVRLYSLLKPHSTVHNKLTNTLDNVVQVACGLINLQSPIIKNK